MKSEKKDDVESVEAPVEKAEQRVVAVTPAPVLNTGITRKINLSPIDWQRATWRPRKALPRPTDKPAPFDLDKSIQRFLAGVKQQYSYWFWNKFRVPDSLTREEAHFWLMVLTTKDKQKEPKKIAADLAKQTFDGKPTTEAVKKLLTAMDTRGGGEAFFLLGRILPVLLNAEDLTRLALEKNVGGLGTASLAVDEMIPYLADEELGRLRKILKSHLDPKDWSKDESPAFHLAARVGMPDELLKVVTSWPDDMYENKDVSNHPQGVIFGLGSAALVEAHIRRLKLPLQYPSDIRAWLAHTEYRALDLVRDCVMNATSTYDADGQRTAKENAEEMLKAFACVEAPEAAPYVLELKLSSQAPSVARQWLEEQVGNAIAGLIPVAAGRGKLAEAAIEYLREAKKKGHEKLIRACLKEADGNVAETVRKEVLDFAEKEYAVLDSKSTPAPLKQAFAVAATGKKFKLPSWAAAATLPPIVIGEKRLDDAQLLEVLHALRCSTFDGVDRSSRSSRSMPIRPLLDAFGWKLFSLWQADGSPSGEMGDGRCRLFGGDMSVLKLTPLVRNWPGESQHQRAVFGLECLRAVGSDTALMQLNGIAQKLKFKGLKQKAMEFMEAIAKDKGLTRSQLEDRIVPDCDLDERGNRIFDFGPRQFRFVLGPEMKPMLKDADGKVKTDLPKPGAKDDAAKADAAVAEWKLLKKQVKEVATIQAQRLEQAMVTGRRWPFDEFLLLLVKHPLMTNLVRLLSGARMTSPASSSAPSALPRIRPSRTRRTPSSRQRASIQSVWCTR